MQKHPSTLLLATGGILLFILSLLFGFLSPLSLQEVAENASLAIARRVAAAEKFVSADRLPDEDGALALYREQKTGIYRYRNNTPVFWNNATLPLPDLRSLPRGIGFSKLRHGYFVHLLQRNDSVSLLALILVKPAFDLQNSYLSNDFRQFSGLPAEVSLKSLKADSAAVNFGQSTLFYIHGTAERYYRKVYDELSTGFLLGAFLLLLVWLYTWAVRRGGERSLFLAALTAVILRVFMLYFHLPGSVYRSSLFDVSIFGNAASLFNAHLGDLVLNGLLLLFLSALSARWLRSKSLYTPQLIWFIFIFGLSANAFGHTLRSLVNNSTLSFDFVNLLEMKPAAFAGLVPLCLYGLSVFLLSHALLAALGLGRRWLLLLPGVLAALPFFFTGDAHAHWLEGGWVLLALLLQLLLYKGGSFSTILSLAVHVLFVSFVTSTLLSRYGEANARRELELLSYQLSEREDPVLPGEFQRLQTPLKNDRNLEVLISLLPVSAESVEMLLRQRYFGGYFDRYSVSFSIFDDQCHPLLPTRDGLLDNQGYFEEQISDHSDSTQVPGLFFVRTQQQNTRYIFRQRLPGHSFYALLDAKQYEEIGSFPELLLDRSQQKAEGLKKLGHAVYRGQALSSQYGPVAYPYFVQDSASMSRLYPLFRHHYYRPEPGSTIVISEPEKKWNYFFTVNSYLLLFFSLLSYLSYLLYAMLFTDFLQSASLTRRIQTTIILLLLIAMSAIGYTSGNLVSRQFAADNERNLEEKSQVIINELLSQFSREQFFEPSRKELLNLRLKEYARLFNTPISLFDRRGLLFTTTESKLYDLGLAAAVVNPQAFKNMKDQYASSQSVTEQAGRLRYLSYYSPVFGADKQLLGFLNLPYFARQAALVTELSGIISALINIYVLLFVISILAGLVLAGYITQPLRLIKQQISGIRLGGKNEMISWQSSDEIGRLVSEYNQMLKKLEESAQLLAQSERETAWREMARQVAHEIKNPLTPMKLNLQYLHHVMEEGSAEDFREKFEKSSKAIIEQIDALANIATEFSNLARLPGARPEKIDLGLVITSAVSIFQSSSRARITNSVPLEKYFVMADREQCLRIFNNIIQNALQAVEQVEDPQIAIDCREDQQGVVISIRDNGCGIDGHLKQNLFQPNFTTKSTGSGLGLAMVKNILETQGNRIWFESEKNKGTVFYLWFGLA